MKTTPNRRPSRGTKQQVERVTDEQFAQALREMGSYFEKDQRTPEDHRKARGLLSLMRKHTRQQEREVKEMERRMGGFK